MNFMKGSLFHRSTEPEEVEIIEESGGGVLAVWGSPGCGKTVTAVKIAKHLASQKKNVALLLCDMTAPMMPCICPPSELECDKSLGSIFAAQRISVNLIKHNLTTHKKLSYLTMLGLRKGENEYTYAACTKQQAEELIRGLREIAPYVVIDCSSYIANDILSAVALMEADSVLRLANCDLKSIGYLSSQLPLLRELHWDEDKQYKAASNIKPLQAADRIGQVLGSVAFQLPHSQELEGQYLEGTLLNDLSMKDSKALLTPDELKSIPKGSFIVMKTGTHPMRTRLQLFLNWGITFGEPYVVPERANRAVAYANRVDLDRNLPQLSEPEEMDESRGYAVSSRGGIAHAPAQERAVKRGKQMKTFGEEER